MGLAEINGLEKGTILKNDEMCDIFGCSPQGGMRRSHATNTLVIVSNHVKSIYDDRWVNGILHYTGMGSSGDQSLSFNQNKTLNESRTNGVAVHLFEVFVDKDYVYMGQVRLISDAYFEPQPDDKGCIRQACVFPLQLVEGELPILDADYVCKTSEVKNKKVRKLTEDELMHRVDNSKNNHGYQTVATKQYYRSPYIAELARRAANGICQLCEQPAPFNRTNGEPYLEIHHIIWLSQGGDDTIDNTVALCPNCHKKMHVVKSKADVAFLVSKSRA